MLVEMDNIAVACLVVPTTWRRTTARLVVLPIRSYEIFTFLPHTFGKSELKGYAPFKTHISVEHPVVAMRPSAGIWKHAADEVRVKPVPAEDLVPGSQTWTSEGQSCESRNAYLCADRRHCCCRFGSVFSAEEDRCSASTDMSDVTSFHIPASHLWTERIEEGTCEPTHSHPCGKSCCCNGKYRWDLEQRLCVLSNEVAEETPFRGLQGPPPKAEAIPGSQTWLGSVTCKDKNAYNCGDHCCCMFGCEYDSEKDACTSCTADDPLVVKYHIPASHLWPSREKQLCDEPFSHLCGKACCCNGDYLWDMEQRRCIPYQASQVTN